jgi:hypothetical protein
MATYPRKHEDIIVKLSGVNGNVFILMSTCTMAMRKAKVDQHMITEFIDTVMSCTSYDEALALMVNTFDVR